ncbi:MAG: gliding motility-associated C-terminal domain-containing protein [Flavobacteriales bacterium]|nr:gliding motility-associated C-terminal domain-containing protein [Flavobacteriales bacterium]
MQKLILFIGLIMFSLTSFSQEICDNGVDDDGDGLIDLNDVTDCNCQGIGGGGGNLSYIPNSDFENMGCCPNGQSDLNCAQGWVQATNRTADYLNTCGFMPAVVTPPAANPNGGGNGMVGLAFSPNYKEYIGACLSQPLLAGTQYQITLDIASCSANGSLNACLGGNFNYPNVDFVIYGNISCANLPANTIDCPVAAGTGWAVLGSTVYTPSNNWSSITITFTPAVNITTIIIGPPCVIPAGFNTCFPYFSVDNLTLNTSLSFIDLTVTEEGSFYTGDEKLHAHLDSLSGSYQWYMNGIALIGEIDTLLDLMPYSCLLNVDTFTFVQTIGGACLSDYQVISNGPPLANFTVNNACTGQVVLLFDSSTPSPSNVPVSNWFWDFDDSSPLDLIQNPTHSYANSGTYNVELIVSDGLCLDTITKQVLITAQDVAAFTYLNTSYCLNDANPVAVITGVAGGIFTIDNGGNINSMTGEVDLLSTGNGIYMVIYTTTGVCPASTIYNLEITVCVIPQAIFTVSDTSICVGDCINFLDQSVGSSSWNWSFSEGIPNSSTLQNPNNICFNNEGIYKIELITGNPLGTIYDTTIRTLVVNPLPIVDAGEDVIINFYGDSVTLYATGSVGNYLWSPVSFLDCPLCIQTDAFPEKTTTYTIFLTDFNGCMASDDVIVTVDVENSFFIPNTFTPNNNGRNDVFRAYGTQVDQFEMQIYNRWGELIFSTNDLEIGWNGTYKGKLVQEGVYVWKIFFKEKVTGKNYRRIGHVNLLK